MMNKHGISSEKHVITMANLHYGTCFRRCDYSRLITQSGFDYQPLNKEGGHHRGKERNSTR